MNHCTTKMSYNANRESFTPQVQIRRIERDRARWNLILEKAEADENPREIARCREGLRRCETSLAYQQSLVTAWEGVS
jgi:hypothetical protein